METRASPRGRGSQHWGCARKGEETFYGVSSLSENGELHCDVAGEASGAHVIRLSDGRRRVSSKNMNWFWGVKPSLLAAFLGPTQMTPASYLTSETVCCRPQG